MANPMNNRTISLLNRKTDESYVEEWTALLQREIALESPEAQQSVVLFRLGGEWLAVATSIFAEIAQRRPIHRIPHRSGPLLLGLTNLRGQMRLCVSLHYLLQIEEGAKQYARMLAIQKGDQRWIFPVDEVYGNHRYRKRELQNVPVTVSKSTANYLKGVIAWEGKGVGVLDEDLLFQSLKRSL